LPTPTTAVAAPEPQEPDTSALRAAALSYAARGWHVIPLRPGGKRPAFPDHAEDRCIGTDPRCRAAGRHVTWQERSTTDADRIWRAWSSLPYGVGIACGPSRMVVVDQDTYKPLPDPAKRARRVAELAALGLPEDADGAAVLAAIVAARGLDLPDTYTVATPSGGRHLYFTALPGVRLTNTAKTLAPSVDTRAWGGQVVAPPSMVDGAAYRVIRDAPVAPLPDWIAEALRPMPPKPVPARTVALTAPAAGSRADRYVQAAIDRETQHVREAPEGERNHALFCAALALGQLVAGGALTKDRAKADLLTAARVHVGVKQFTEAEAVKTIASGLRKGAGRPRPVTGQAA
jgi:hypothetical protein